MTVEWLSVYRDVAFTLADLTSRTTTQVLGAYKADVSGLSAQTLSCLGSWTDQTLPYKARTARLSKRYLGITAGDTSSSKTKLSWEMAI